MGSPPPGLGPLLIDVYKGMIILKKIKKQKLTLSILRSSAGADGAVMSFIVVLISACWLKNCITSSRLDRLQWWWIEGESSPNIRWYGERTIILHGEFTIIIIIFTYYTKAMNMWEIWFNSWREPIQFSVNLQSLDYELRISIMW